MKLAYYTTNQLVSELIKRNTFAGIVIQSVKEVKGRQRHQEWSINSTANLTIDKVHSILGEITTQLGKELTKS